jgi:hypothetical protein
LRANIDDNHGLATGGKVGNPLRTPSAFDATYAYVDGDDNVRCQYDPKPGAPGPGGEMPPGAARRREEVPW